MESLMKKRAQRILQYSVIIIPVLVALSQFVLYKTTDLTLWKGGGFGMYSNPHPATSRNVWIVGETSGTNTYYRLHTLDFRLKIPQIENRELRDSLYDLAEYARKMRYFPSLINKQNLSTSYTRLLQELEGEPQETSMIPRESAKLIVTEISLTPDYQYIEMTPIYEYALAP
jgi:hypothetical protein